MEDNSRTIGALVAKVCRRWMKIAQPKRSNQHLWIWMRELDSEVYVELLEALKQSEPFDVYVDFQYRQYYESTERDFHSLLVAFRLLHRHASRVAAVSIEGPHSSYSMHILSQLAVFPRIHTLRGEQQDPPPKRSPWE
jgi:hypothetical protein